MATPYHQLRDRDYLCGVGPSHHYPAHFHKQVEILYVTGGGAAVNAGFGTQQMRKGDLAIFFPNVVHSYEDNGCSGQTTMVIFNETWAGGLSQILRSQHPLRPVLPREELHQDIPALMDMLRRQQQEEPVVCAALFQLVLARALPGLQLEENSDTEHYDLPRQALEYVQKHAYEPLGLATAAEALGVSASRLSRIFTGRLGVSFTRYVQLLRVEQAKALLAQSDDPILQIAYDCGFEGPRNFGRVFRALCGTTPRAWRQANQKEKTDAM